MSATESDEEDPFIGAEQWSDIVRRLFDIIDRKLSVLERDDDKAKSLTPADARAVTEISKTMERVRVLDEQVRQQLRSARTQKRNRQNDSAREDLQRRLARLAKPE